MTPLRNPTEVRKVWNHLTDDGRIDKLNELMKTVSTIGSETVSLYDPKDPLTTWDSEYCNIVTYIDGRVTRNNPSKTLVSPMLHRIDKILKSWGLEFKSISDREDRMLTTVVKYSIETSGDIREDIDVDIEINCCHKDLIKIKHPWRDFKWESNYKRCGEWIQYSEDLNIEKIINDFFIGYLKQYSNTQLSREFLLRNILS
jgi:hypothetical protein